MVNGVSFSMAVLEMQTSHVTLHVTRKVFIERMYVYCHTAIHTLYICMRWICCFKHTEQITRRFTREGGLLTSRVNP